MAKGTFDWGLYYKWDYFDWSYFDTEENNIKPYKTPAMSGGTVVQMRDFHFVHPLQQVFWQCPANSSAKLANMTKAWRFGALR